MLNAGVAAQQFPLAEGIKEVELRLKCVGAIQAGGTHFKILSISRSRWVTEGLPMIARHQAKAGLYPSFKYSALTTVGIEAPAANHSYIVSFDPALSSACKSHLLGPLESEMDSHVITKDLGPHSGHSRLQATKKVAMQFGNPIQQ